MKWSLFLIKRSNMLITSLVLVILISDEFSQYSNVKNYDAYINVFFSIDSKHINPNPFNAFNNSPGHFIDMNGKAPVTAEQILVSRFGDERRLEYRLLDHLFSDRKFGLYNRQFFKKSLSHNAYVEKWLTNEIRNKLLERLPPQMVHISGGIQQQVQHQYRNGYIQMKQIKSREQNVELVRETIVNTLQESAAENLLWQNGFAAEIYIKEAQIWRHLTQISQVHNDFFLINGTELNLTTDELDYLYAAKNYQYSTLLRMHVNSRSLIQNGEGIRPHEFIHRQFRQKKVTINGIDHHSRVVQFRSVFGDY